MVGTCGACGEQYGQYFKHKKVCIKHKERQKLKLKGMPVVQKTARTRRTKKQVQQELCDLNELSELALWDICELRYLLDWRNKQVVTLKKLYRRWRKAEVEQSFERLKTLLREGVVSDDVVQALTFDLFAGIETAKKERTQASKHIPYITPRVVHLGDGHTCVQTSLVDALTQKMVHDPEFRRSVLAKSEEWKKGENWKSDPTELQDSDDGVEWRYDDELMKPLVPDEEEHDVRIAVVMSADDYNVGHRTVAPPPCRPSASRPRDVQNRSCYVRAVRSR